MWWLKMTMYDMKLAGVLTTCAHWAIHQIIWTRNSSQNLLIDGSVSIYKLHLNCLFQISWMILNGFSGIVSHQLIHNWLMTLFVLHFHSPNRRPPLPPLQRPPPQRPRHRIAFERRKIGGQKRTASCRRGRPASGVIAGGWEEAIWSQGNPVLAP